VFCHGGVIRRTLSILLELPLSKMSAFDFDYASVSEIEWQPHRMEIQLLNFTPWRELTS
jgi:broad specificity phosphatase PhoE